MIDAHVAVRDGIRPDVTEALPTAIQEEFGEVIEAAEERRAQTPEHEIRPYLPSVQLTLLDTVEQDAFEDALTALGDSRDCTYELRSWDDE